MRDQRARAATISLVCLVAAGCTAAQVAEDNPAAPEGQRLMRLAGDVEARGDYGTASALYARAAETSGNASEARVRLGNAAMKVHDYKTASEAFAKVLETDPQNVDALLGLGTAQLKSGDIEASARTLDLACPLDDTSTACNRLGTALIMLGRLDDALAAFDRAQALAPNDLDIEVNIALAQALAGHTTEAVNAMQEVAQAPAALPRHRANLVMVLAIAGRLDEARAVNIPTMSRAQRQELLARAKKVRDATTPLAKARAIGLSSTG